MDLVSEETTIDGGGPPKDKAKSNGKPKAIPLPAKRELHEKHLANLRASGLTDETIKLAELYTEYHHKLLAELMQRKTWPRMCGAALVFPFYMPGATEPLAYRVRPTTPRVEKRGNKSRPVKYDQSEHVGALVYFTPRARAGNWYADSARTLFWTEGEKKSLVFDQLDLACVGLTGVWNWTDRKHRDETGEERLHPAIREHVAVAGRHHIICYDADARDNEQVMLAAARLCGQLLHAGALSVRFVCPPTREQKGVDDFFFAFGEEVTRKLLDSAGEIEPADPKQPLQRVTKLRALAKAPVNDQLRMPEGYQVEKDGTLWRIGDAKHGDTKIARSAILLQRHLHDYYTNDGRVELCFERDDRWVSLCVERKAIADSRTMVGELARFGAPVTSNSAPKIVDWLDDFERVNGGYIERVACVGRCGWHTIDGERVFVLDEPVFEDPEQSRPLALDTRGDRRKLFGALVPRGTFEQHLEALRRAWQTDPVAAIMICGALSASLLEPLGAPNFAIHLPGDSSRGKTSMLKIAASVFGDPHNDQWVASWNTTNVAAEIRAAVLTDLPQCYDEVGSSDPQTIERLVYMLVNGGGRARGQRDLTLRETPTWRTVVLSTGERQLADETTATGAQIRVIQVPVVGFGRLTAAEIDELRETCAANSGSLGRRWIEMLLGIDDWAPFRERVRVAVKRLRKHAKDSLQGRTAAYFAVLGVTEALASAQLGLGEPLGATMEALFQDHGSRESVLTLADRSVELVRDWVASERDAFPELEMAINGYEEPSRKGASRTLNGFRKDNLVMLIPLQLRAFCSHHHLSAREVLRAWSERGWLQHSEPTKVVRVGQQTHRMHVLNIEPEASTEPDQVDEV